MTRSLQNPGNALPRVDARLTVESPHYQLLLGGIPGAHEQRKIRLLAGRASSAKQAAAPCRVVYIRPDPEHGLAGYAADHNKPFEFDDHRRIRKDYPEVIVVQDVLARQHEAQGPGATYNELQLLLHAQSDKFISVLGGNSVIASYFSGAPGPAGVSWTLANGQASSQECSLI